MMGYTIGKMYFTDSGTINSIGIACMPGSSEYVARQEIKRQQMERAKRWGKVPATLDSNKIDFDAPENTETDEIASEVVDEVIQCGALLFCNNMQADIDTFSAVNDAGLVYDSGIVVDAV